MEPADNPKKERKKQLVRYIVRQTKETKETSINNLTFAASMKEKKEEELRRTSKPANLQ